MGCSATSAASSQPVRCSHGLWSSTGTTANTATNAYQLSAAHERLSSARRIKASVPHTASDDEWDDATAGLRIVKSASAADSAATTATTATPTAAATCFTALSTSGTFDVSGSAGGATTDRDGSNRICFVRTHYATAHWSSVATRVHSTSARPECLRATYERQPGSHESASDDHPTTATTWSVATTSSPAVTFAYTWPNTSIATANAC